MNPNQPRYKGWRTKEQARKRRHDIPAPPNTVAPPPQRNPELPLCLPYGHLIPGMSEALSLGRSNALKFLRDSIASSKVQSQRKASTSSAAKDKGKSIAQPLMDQDTSATTNNTSDGDYEPPPSFEYNEEIQSRYTAHRGKAKVGVSSSVPRKLLKLRGEGKSAASPSSFDARSPLPKPKPQVLGLVCKRSQPFVEEKKT